MTVRNVKILIPELFLRLGAQASSYRHKGLIKFSALQAIDRPKTRTFSEEIARERPQTLQDILQEGQSRNWMPVVIGGCLLSTANMGGDSRQAGL